MVICIILYTARLCIENKFQQMIVEILSWATVPAAILAALSHARGIKTLLRSFDSSDLPFQTPTLHDRRQFVFPRVVPCLLWLFRVLSMYCHCKLQRGLWRIHFTVDKWRQKKRENSFVSRYLGKALPFKRKSYSDMFNSMIRSRANRPADMLSQIW